MGKDKYEVVGYGALNMDKILALDGPITPNGETFARTLEETPGGSAANTITGLSRLGANTAFIGAIADDTIGNAFLRNLAQEGITPLILEKKGEKSGTCVAYTYKNDRFIVVEPEVNDKISIDDIPDSTMNAIKNAKYFFSSTFACKYASYSLETQLELVKIAKDNGTKTILSPGALYSNPELLRKEKGDIIEEILSNTDILFLNEDEIKMLTGIESYAKACDDIIERYGIETIAVTRGKDGCYIVTKDEEIYRGPCPAENIKDSVGAGDSFAAGFVYGLINGKDLYTCGKLGNYVASQVIQHTGARAGLPRGDDPIIQRLLAQ